MTRFVSPGGIEVTTPTVDGVQRYRVKDLGGIGGRSRTWLGDYFTEEALYARLAELGTDPARLEEVPSGFRPCPVHRDRGSRGAAGCLPWAVRCGRAYVLLGKRSRAVQDPGTWSCFGGAVAEGESPAQAAERECREEVRGITARPGTTSYVGECAACGWQYTTFLAHVGLARGALPEVRAGRETDQARWVRVAHVRRLNLNPGFAVAWANLRHAVEAQAASENRSHQDRHLKGGEEDTMSIADTTTETTAHKRTFWRSEYARSARV